MRALALGLLLVLTGCSASTHPAARSTPSPTVSPTLAPGRDAFVAFAQSGGFRVSAESAADLLDLGGQMCSALAGGGVTPPQSFDQTVQLWSSGANGPALFTPAEAGAFVRSAVNNLCPEQKIHLP